MTCPKQHKGRGRICAKIWLLQCPSSKCFYIQSSKANGLFLQILCQYLILNNFLPDCHFHQSGIQQVLSNDGVYLWVELFRDVVYISKIFLTSPEVINHFFPQSWLAVITPVPIQAFRHSRNYFSFLCLFQISVFSILSILLSKLPLTIAIVGYK